MDFKNLKRRATKVEPPKPSTLSLTKDECIVLLNLISEGSIKIKSIQYVYDLVYKIQEFAQQDDNKKE